MKKIYTLVAVFCAGAAIAQAPYQMATYNFSAYEKYTPGGITVIPMHNAPTSQDRTVYYTEDFDGGFNGWANNTLVGTAPFKLTNVGHDNGTGNSFIIPALESSTPTQWIVLDSDKDGTSYAAPEEATFTSPVIDLSTSLGNYVAVEFDQFFAEWDVNIYSGAGSSEHCYIGVSTNGTTWTEVEINEGVGRDGRPNPEHISWDISDHISGALSTVYIRFRWTGAWNYGWQFDNVEIVDINEKDVAIVGSYRNYNANGLMFSKVPVDHASEFTVGAIIRNIGHIPQTGVTFSYVIKDPSNATVASGTATASLSLLNAQQDTILVATGYTPTALGVYTVEWTATSNEGDDNLTDNLKTDNFFELTPYTYAMDYNQGPVVPITNWPLTTGIATFGNLFSFEGADVVSAIEVKIANETSNIGEIIYTTVWYNDGVSGWLLLDEGDQYTVTAANIGQIITLPFPDGIDVNDNDLYLFGVSQYATPVDALFERQGDIGFSYIQGIDEAAALRGFFDRRAPIVRLRVIDEVGIEDEAAPVANTFSIYPNPANESINVKLTLNESSATVINVVDITGKAIKTINLGDVNGTKNVTVSLDELSTGVYFIELVNADGKQIKKFVKK